jgi:hypothetical protein
VPVSWLPHGSYFTLRKYDDYLLLPERICEDRDFNMRCYHGHLVEHSAAKQFVSGEAEESASMTRLTKW